MLNRWIGGWLAGCLFLFSIQGCAVNQNKEIKIYQEVIGESPSKEALSFHAEEGLSLVQALKLANANNEKLAIAGEDYLQALIDKDRAFAAFLPTLSLAGVFMRQDKTSFGAGNPLITDFVPDRATDVPVSGSMTVNPLHDTFMVRAAGKSV